MKRRNFIGLIGAAAILPLAPWPSRVLAQQAPPVGPTIGVLTLDRIPDWMIDSIRKGLGEFGYVEGRNCTIVHRSAQGQTDRLPGLATELVNARVTVIFATGGPLPARAAKAATAILPIVFAYGGDPVTDGLVSSLNRPGANVTGATFIGASLVAKRLELMRQLMPRATDAALLVNPTNTLAKGQAEDAIGAAKILGLRLHVLNVSNAGEMDEAFAEMDRLKINLAVVGVDPTFGLVLADQIVALSIRYRIPTTGELMAVEEAGSLMGYGPVLADTWRQAGNYAGRILKGAKPSDLPVLQPTRFEFAINLKTAKVLGLDVPPGLLAIADDIFE